MHSSVLHPCWRRKASTLPPAPSTQRHSVSHTCTPTPGHHAQMTHRAGMPEGTYGEIWVLPTARSAAQTPGASSGHASSPAQHAGHNDISQMLFKGHPIEAAGAAALSHGSAACSSHGRTCWMRKQRWTAGPCCPASTTWGIRRLSCPCYSWSMLCAPPPPAGGRTFGLPCDCNIHIALLELQGARVSSS